MAQSGAPATETVVVTATHDQDKPSVATSVGVTSYTADQSAIANVPGGDSASFQQVLLRLPGVVQDSYGEVHIRGEHGNAGYRINGVLLPEGLEGFGQEFDSHFIQSAALSTGALPAQFGLRTSGIIDITTKSGSDLDGGEAGVYGGSFETIKPYLDYGNSDGATDYFFSLSDQRSDLGIENPTPSNEALHDHTNQYKAFGSISEAIDAQDKVTLLAAATYANFQIPDVAGQTPDYSVSSLAVPPSAELNDNQNERDYFAVLAYQAERGDLSVQTSAFYHFDRIRFVPDEAGDLAYLGAAGLTRSMLQSEGLQADASYPLGAHHLQAGFAVEFQSYNRRDTTDVFAAGAGGIQLSDVPFAILDADSQTGVIASGYLQDSWQIARALTVNYGLRFDRYHGFTDAQAWSPRLNVVYQADNDTTIHVGYAHYFTPPGLEYVSATNVARFAGTTNAPSVLTEDPPYPERAHYLDAGLVTQLTTELTASADSFYKRSTGGLDLGQFGQAVVLTPFNYDHGETYGFEQSLQYRSGPWSAQFSFAYVRAIAEGITSAQSEFDAAELAYIDSHPIVLDHDQPFTFSLDTAYALPDSHTRLFGDFLFGSGLRYGFANLGTLDPHYQLNLGAEYLIPLNQDHVQSATFRLDCTNVFDQRAELRAGSGVGIFAPQYLPPRGIFGTFSLGFG